MAEEADRSSQIRGELQRLGVAKVDLAFRSRQGRYRAGRRRPVASQRGRMANLCRSIWPASSKRIRSFFRHELPAEAGRRLRHEMQLQARSASIEIDKIKPGMSKEDLDRVRQEISRLATQALRGV